jgi:hypothetical protein
LLPTGRVDSQRDRVNRRSGDDLISFPAHTILIVEERLREQQVEGVRMPEGMSLDELAFRVLIAAQTGEVPSLD